MFAEYIQAALDKAEYKLIDDPEPVFGEVPELEGVWATGSTVEECRKELISVIEGWIAEANDKGMDGQAMYDDAKALIEKYSTN